MIGARAAAARSWVRPLAYPAWRSQDVTASVDAVVAKAGYGTLAECMAAGTPLIFPPRPSFAEHEALAAGAQTVMVGSLLAGTKESPGMVVVRNGRRFKVTRGMASLEATMSRDQKVEARGVQSQREYERVVPEGVEARVPYHGPVDAILYQLVGGLRSGLSYAGARTIEELQANAEFVQITTAGKQESGPHDVDHS